MLQATKDVFWYRLYFRKFQYTLYPYMRVAEKFIGWLWCNGRIWQCGLFFNLVSPAVHTFLPFSVAALGFLWYRSTRPDLRKSPQLQMWHHRSIYCFLQPSGFFFMLGNRKLDVPNQKNTDSDQTVQTSSHTAAIATTDLCSRALSWWNRTPFFSFPGSFEMSSSTTFQGPELFSVGLSGRTLCSIRKGGI